MQQTFFRSLLALFVLSGALLAQTDRGTIAGTVTDPSSAAVANAKVEVMNAENGSLFNTTTTDAGTFIVPQVPSGKYNVAVTAPGFKVANQLGVQVSLDQTSKISVVLQIGQSTESISVSAAVDVLKTDNAEQSMNVSGDKVNELPLNFSAGQGGIRNWLSFTYLAPGVAGTGAGSEVNGLPGNNFKIYLEGQDSTSNNDTGWTSTVAAASVEAITEFAVQSSNFSAEFGQVMGGLYNFTTKSGSNQYHGSAYENWANEVLDARHPFNHLKDKDRKNDYGFSIGGPVRIPKIYNGKNKHTFFFFNWERFGNNLASAAQTGTLPTAAYRAGDFGSALYATSTNGTGPTVLLTDATSGYQYLQNQIFDPDTTTTDSKGRVIRQPFANNLIPQSRLDPVALKVQALIPNPTGTQNTLNWAPNIIANTQQMIPSVKIDQDLGPKTKLSAFWTRQTTNQIAAADGLPSPLTSSRPKLVEGNQYRFNLDQTITPTLIGHLGVGFYRFHNPDSSPESVLNYDAAGLLGLVGSSTGVGFPAISGLSVNNEGSAPGFGPTTADHQTTDMASITANLSWTRGKHTYKAGVELKQNVYSDENLQGAEGVYAFNGAQTAIPFLGSTTVGSGTSGSIGSGYASFLLGDYNSTTVNPPKSTQLRRYTQGVYFQDSIRLTPKLTIELGLRWDRAPLGKELHDRQSEIGLSTPNPNAGNLPGGFIFAGYGTGRCNCEFSKTYNLALGPRLSAAYQLNTKTVVRAGWAVSYSGGDSWAYLNGGYSLNGLGYNSVQTSAPSFGGIYGQFKNGLVYDHGQLSTTNLSPGVNTVANQLNTFSSVWGGLYNDAGAGRPARVNQWNIALQRQLSHQTSIEAAYVGNRGVWEQANNMLPLNTITPDVLAAHHLDLTDPNTRTLMTSQIGSAAAKAAGFTIPYAGFPTTASVAQSLRPFPMYNTGIPVEFVNRGSSWYDSLQVKFNKHLSRGLDVTSNYTFGKTLNLGNSGINGNALDRDEQKGLDPADQRHVWVSAITFVTPKFTSNKFIREVAGGWTWGGTLRYASGSLIGAPGSQNSKWNTYTFASNTYEYRVAGQPLFLTDINCGCIDPNNPTQRILNPAAWQDVSAGTLGGGSRYYSDYRGPHQVSENMNLGRTFQFREKMSLNIRVDLYNVFNRVTLGTPSSGNPAQATTINNATGAISGFGFYSIGNTSNFGGQRSGDLVARFVSDRLTSSRNRKVRHNAGPFVFLALLGAAQAHAASPSYVGAAACGKCHAANFAGQSKTGHAHALTPSSAGQPGNWAFGAGLHAITFLTKLDRESYREEGRTWYRGINSYAISPGHHDQNGIVFRTFDPVARILSCFACHSTGPLSLGKDDDVMPHELGVRCEVCHGPGSAHVADPVQNALRTPRQLTAAAMNKFCAQCHRVEDESGEQIADLRDFRNARDQPLRLAASACFRNSTGRLNCFTCHTPHQELNADLASYNTRCQNCHANKVHRISVTGQACVTCHMPRVPNGDLLSFANHRIAVYAPNNPLVPIGR